MWPLIIFVFCEMHSVLARGINWNEFNPRNNCLKYIEGQKYCIEKNYNKAEMGTNHFPFTVNISFTIYVSHSFFLNITSYNDNFHTGN